MFDTKKIISDVMNALPTRIISNLSSKKSLNNSKRSVVETFFVCTKCN